MPNPPGRKRAAIGSLNVPGFPQFRPNRQLAAADFPLNGWFRPTELTPRGSHTLLLDEFANVSHDTNDVISSQGVRHTMFTGVTPGIAVDQGTREPDISILPHRARSTRTRWCAGSRAMPQL